MKVRSEDEIEQRLRKQFQEYGYYDVDVQSVEAKPIDPLEKVPRVHVTAEVAEGARYRIGTIEFKNIKALTAEELRAQFPIKTGDYFSRGKLGTGMEAVRKAYTKLGYIDCYAVPEVSKSDQRLNVSMDVTEGHQYRMGELQFAGNDDAAEKLRPQWALDTGQPFDASYLGSFIKANESLFPAQFDSSRSVKIARNCKEDTVTVFLELGPNHPKLAPPKDIGCED